jgi:hypothetical protein
MGIFRKIKTGKEKPGHKQTGAFVALAQVCKQIRFEYRPLWLRQLRIRVDFSDLEEFLQVFYCVSDRHEDWYRDAPTILTIAWDHDENDYGDGDTLISIESLLKLHAYSPASTIEFECRRLAESDLPCTDCWECGLCVHCVRGPFSIDCNFSSDVYDSHYTCEHDETIGEIVSVLAAEYEYLAALNTFLNNNNAAWLKHVQEKSLDYDSISCTMGKDCGQATIYIRFREPEAPKHLRTRNMHRGASAYLTEMGMADLEGWQELDYVVGVRTDKYSRSIDGVPEPVYDQALIRDLKSKTRSSSAQAVKQAPDSAVQG